MRSPFSPGLVRLATPIDIGLSLKIGVKWQTLCALVDLCDRLPSPASVATSLPIIGSGLSWLHIGTYTHVVGGSYPISK